MSEATRGWIYRLAVLALAAYVVAVHPDKFVEWVPVIIGLGNGLASLNTSVRR